MEKFTRVCGVAAPFMAADVNTDNIMPSIYNRDNPDNLGPGLFYNWRFLSPGVENPEFFLNLPRYRGAKILVAGENFGCGSSRENAVWGLTAYGVRCVIASSYGDIFRDNAFQNGLLPLILPRAQVDELAALLEKAEAPSLCVDLEHRRIEALDRAPISFELADDRRSALMEGLDETQLLLRNENEIAAFQRADRVRRPWIYERSPTAPKNP